MPGLGTLRGGAPSPVPRACPPACAAEELPGILAAAPQEAESAAVQPGFGQGRVSAAEPPAAPPGFTPAAPAVKTLRQPRAGHAGQLLLLSPGAVMGHTGGEEKESRWFQENFVEKPWCTRPGDGLLGSHRSQTGVGEFICCPASNPGVVPLFNSEE